MHANREPDLSAVWLIAIRGYPALKLFAFHTYGPLTFHKLGVINRDSPARSCAACLVLARARADTHTYTHTHTHTHTHTKSGRTFCYYSRKAGVNFMACSKSCPHTRQTACSSSHVNPIYGIDLVRCYPPRVLTN